MLKTTNRLQKKKDFERVFKGSRPFITANFSIRSKESNLGYSRFGFIISNKIDKRSTRRNALKRQLRSVVYDLISEIKPGYDVVVLVKRDPVFPYVQGKIREELLIGFKRNGLL